MNEEQRQRAERDALEEHYLKVIEGTLDEFVRSVIHDAASALNAPVLVASADPFAFTNVMKRWYTAVRSLAQKLPGAAGILDLLEQADLPDFIFTNVVTKLEQAKAEGWTEYRLKRHLSKELIPKQKKNEPREGYRARVSEVARASATRTQAMKSLSGMEKSGYARKRWVSRQDARVRDTHYEAHGQEKAVGEPFLVGGELLQYPCDPAGSAAQTANCRCVIIGVEEDESLTASATTEVDNMDKIAPRWGGILGVEGKITGDGRFIEPNALSWEGMLPVPLRFVREDVGAHDGAQVVGLCDTIERREDGMIWGEGPLDVESEIGAEAFRHLSEGWTTGVSLDLDDVSFTIQVASEIVAEQEALMEAIMNDEEIEQPERKEGQDGRVIVAEINSDDEVMSMSSARVRGMTIVSIPAFADARLSILEGDGDLTTEEVAEEVESIVASLTAAGPAYRSAWFADPKLDGPTPFTITDDGRVFGHLALWEACHIGFVGECKAPPYSAFDYSYFHTGALATDQGTIATGRITFDTGHAGDKLHAQPAAAHYDNTGKVGAYVCAGEDQFGIWVAGQVKHGLPDKSLEDLRGAPLSGDWREVRGNLELVAALAVNVGGFSIPRPRGFVASGVQRSLVAGGILVKSDFPRRQEGLSESDVKTLKALVHEAQQRKVMQMRAKLLKDRVNQFGGK